MANFDARRLLNISSNGDDWENMEVEVRTFKRQILPLSHLSMDLSAGFYEKINLYI